MRVFVPVEESCVERGVALVPYRQGLPCEHALRGEPADPRSADDVHGVFRALEARARSGGAGQSRYSA